MGDCLPSASLRQDCLAAWFPKQSGVMEYIVAWHQQHQAQRFLRDSQKIRFALRKSFISNFEMASMMLSCIGMRKIGFVSVHAVVFVDCAQVTMDQAHELPDSDLALTWLISNYSKQSDFEDISCLSQIFSWKACCSSGKARNGWKW